MIANGKKRALAATYPYHDEDGGLLYESLRYDPKDFSQRRPDGQGGYAWNLKGVRRVPYCLPELLSGIAQKRTVFVCEGEKDADTLRAQHFIATTNAGGTGWPWTQEFAAHFRGAPRVIVIADSDKAGRDAALARAALLCSFVDDVRRLDLACERHDGFDVTDWFGDGHTATELRALVDRAPRIDDDEQAEPSASEFYGSTDATNGVAGKVETPVDWGDARPWPTLSEDALYGLAGDFVRLVAPQSEADLSALLAQFLCAFGCAAGPSAHFMVEATRHTARIWALVVGKTAGGRKGTAKDQVNRVFRIADEEWFEASQVSGLASGEGLLQRLRDRPEPIEKRVLVVESEFERTLAAIARDGSTLGAILRDLYDTDRAQNLTRKDPLIAKGCHVSVIAHITPEALREKLTSTDIANGSFNRFLPVCSKRRQRLPHGGNLSASDLAALAKRLRTAIDFAREVREMRRTTAANDAWERFYYAVPEPEGLLGATTARAEGQVLRLSLLFALLDGKEIVDVPHLHAAEALWDYVKESAGHIFGSKLGDRIADPILKKLRETYPASVSREDLRSVVFSNHVDADSLTNAIAHLVRRGLISSDEVKTGGRSRETLRAVPPCAESAESAKSKSASNHSTLSALSAHREADCEDGVQTEAGDGGLDI